MLSSCPMPLLTFSKSSGGAAESVAVGAAPDPGLFPGVRGVGPALGGWLALPLAVGAWSTSASAMRGAV